MWKCPKCGRDFKNKNQSHYCKITPQSIEEYITQQPEYAQLYLRQINETIQFPYDKPLPLELIEEIAAWCETAYGTKK